MSKLVIVESPAKAETIKKYLGKDYKVMASMGHLRDLPKSQFGVDIEHNFTPKYITIRGKSEIINKLKKEAKGSQAVYLATDPDREGEAISWHLAKLLNLDESQPIRITFNEITKSAVKAGIKTPRTIDENLVNAQQARRILDRIVGYKLSPVLWRRVKKGLSAGRVQSVSTRLIVDKEREITAFVPKEYWNIEATYTNPQNSKKTFTSRFNGSLDGKKIPLSSKEETDKVLSGIEGKPHIISGIKRGEKQKSPAPPFITSTLQQEASKKLNFQSRRTMSIAQQLYEGVNIKGKGAVGLITYMRTDSLRVSNEAISAVREYIVNKFGESCCPSKPRFYKSKKNAQDAHEAIRPTDLRLDPNTVHDSLTPEQYKLYKLIWDRFAASQMENAVYDTVNIDITVGDYLFKTGGQTIKFKGYTAIYKDNSEDEEAEKSNLPTLNEHDELNLKKIESEQKFTQPPQRYTEASLIKALEENGIGRPSTYAPTITTILARGYVVREKKQLKPTILGEITTDLLTEYFNSVVDIDFTAHMEDLLDEVEAGNKIWTDTLHEFYNGFEKTLNSAEERLGDFHAKVPDVESDVVCEKCGRKMVYKLSKFGKFLACPGFPECRNTKPIVEETGVMCPLCDGRILIKKSKSNKKYYGCEHNPTCSFLSWDEPTNEKCPKCGSILLKRISGKKMYCYNKECGFERELKK